MSDSIRAWMLGSASMSTDTLFAQWLREEMVKRGYPLEGPRAGGITRLAAATGISQATMSRTIRGQQEPSIDTLRKVGDLFGFDLVQMMAFAGLAEYTQVGAPADDAETGGTFKVIDGGAQDPAKYTEADFFSDIALGVEPPYPPYGLRPGDDSETTIWALPIPPDVRWAAIRGKRSAQDERSARDAAQRRTRPQPETDHPREINGR